MAIETAARVDHTLPREKWAFDEGVTSVFDNMLARSIPQYSVMRDACYQLGRRYVQHGTDIVDLGCSRGEALKLFVDEFGAYCHYYGVEIAQPMLIAARLRFAALIDRNVMDILDMDLRQDYPPAKASLTLCVLTLQFTPIEYRLQILDRIYQHTLPGGALILVEKVLGATARLNEDMVSLYLAMKAQNGYSREEIDRKKSSLEGVLVPVTARWNEEMLRGAGFREVDCFWRWMNFAGWLGVK